MLIGRVVEHKVHLQPDPALVTRLDKILKVVDRAVLVVDAVVIGHVVLVIRRRGVYRHHPDTVDSEIGRRLVVAVVEIIEVVDKPAYIAYTVAVAVGKTADKDLVVCTAVVLRYIVFVSIGRRRAVLAAAYRAEPRSRRHGKRRGYRRYLFKLHLCSFMFSRCRHGKSIR